MATAVAFSLFVYLYLAQEEKKTSHNNPNWSHVIHVRHYTEGRGRFTPQLACCSALKASLLKHAEIQLQRL